MRPAVWGGLAGRVRQLSMMWCRQGLAQSRHPAPMPVLMCAARVPPVPHLGGRPHRVPREQGGAGRAGAAAGRTQRRAGPSAALPAALRTLGPGLMAGAARESPQPQPHLLAHLLASTSTTHATNPLLSHAASPTPPRPAGRRQGGHTGRVLGAGCAAAEAAYRSRHEARCSGYHPGPGAAGRLQAPSCGAARPAAACRLTRPAAAAARAALPVSAPPPAPPAVPPPAAAAPAAAAAASEGSASPSSLSPSPARPPALFHRCRWPPASGTWTLRSTPPWRRSSSWGWWS